MGIEEERLAEFFDAYAAALREFDAEATAQLWGLPGMIVTDDFAGALESRADMAAGLASSYPHLPPARPRVGAARDPRGERR